MSGHKVLASVPPDVIACGASPLVPLCADCIDAYRNGIEPGGTACELKARIVEDAGAIADSYEFREPRLVPTCKVTSHGPVIVMRWTPRIRSRGLWRKWTFAWDWKGWREERRWNKEPW